VKLLLDSIASNTEHANSCQRTIEATLIVADDHSFARPRKQHPKPSNQGFVNFPKSVSRLRSSLGKPSRETP
jgi:hypothetical protein